MNKSILFRLFCLSIFLVLTSFNNTTSNLANANTNSVSSEVSVKKSSSSLSEVLFEKLRLGSKGLAEEVLSTAIKGYEKLVEEGVVENLQYLSIVDLSQSSRNKRFYILDLKNDELALNTYVAHGKNSGADVAERFSNSPNSEESSLGFYVTKDTYLGKHGLSLKLSGLEEGFNSNAESRAIVVHGANYVNEARAHSAYMGRSQGCPALPQSVAPKVISMIKGGSAVFVYNPDQKYLSQSKILNS